MHLIKFFLKDEAGVSVVEYALIMGMLAIALISAITMLGETVSNFFSGFATTIGTM